MMVENLSDERKSVMLATAMGLKTEPHPHEWEHPDHLIVIPDEWDHGWELVEDFYSPENMHLAWRVLNWAARHFPYIYEWWEESIDMLEKSPTDAQRLWLDEILEFAIEAGIVEVE